MVEVLENSEMGIVPLIERSISVKASRHIARLVRGATVTTKGFGMTPVVHFLEPVRRRKVPPDSDGRYFLLMCYVGAVSGPSGC